MLPDKLLEIAGEAIAACDGEALCEPAAASLEGPVELVGAGKAAVAMARGVMASLEVRSGLLCTKDVDDFAPPGVQVRIAGHPSPDARSAAAGEAMVRKLSLLTEDERAVAVLSGGASSLLAAPVAGLSIAELRRANDALVGADIAISDINVVRKHITRASGGRLARACRASLDVLVISDVLGDDIAAIGSGPFAPDPSTFEQALAVARRAPDIGGAVLSLLERGARGDLEETPKPGDDCFARVRHHLLASHATLIDAAVAAASRAGFAHVSTLPPETGTVVEAARRYAERAAQLRPGEIVVSGGEPTVELPRGAGLGGRNQQLALLVARALFSRGNAAVFLALGSDGSDGPTDAAGALVDERSWDVLSRTGDPESALARADAYPILDAAGALVRTGLTGTNVLDLHLLARA